MRWLIDGYNVIRRDPDLRAHEAESLEAGRRALLVLVAHAARAGGDRFTVVFDGAPASRSAPAAGQVEVSFSRPPEKADDVLVRLARQLGAGSAVVTSDRAVRDAAGRAGCAVIGAEQFLDALSAAPEPGRSYGRPPTGQGELADPAPTDEGDLADHATKDKRDDVDPAPKSGNPRRLSKDARAAERALRRLRGS
jgi:predicted RNA-binding protein with PIN domain